MPAILQMGCYKRGHWTSCFGQCRVPTRSTILVFSFHGYFTIRLFLSLFVSFFPPPPPPLFFWEKPQWSIWSWKALDSSSKTERLQYCYLYLISRHVYAYHMHIKLNTHTHQISFHLEPRGGVGVSVPCFFCWNWKCYIPFCKTMLTSRWTSLVVG